MAAIPTETEVTAVEVIKCLESSVESRSPDLRSWNKCGPVISLETAGTNLLHLEPLLHCSQAIGPQTSFFTFLTLFPLLTTRGISMETKEVSICVVFNAREGLQ